MNFNFKDKVVVVTGASRGIGKGIALAFAKAGAKVALTYQNNDDAAKIALEEISRENNDVHHGLYKFDASDLTQVEESFKKIHEEMGAIHVLINNAGITRDQLLLRLKSEDWDQVLQANLKSVYACTKTAVKMMLKAKEGAIVNITSVIGQTGNAGQSNYAASKAGIIAFTKSVAQEVASRQIRLNCIAPGFISSDMTNSLTDDQKTKIMDLIPLGFMGESHDIGMACLFLASPAARYITGHTLNVDGGMNMNH
jgi:3-oxoacyl-[acyl-carrier protein] reductase